MSGDHESAGDPMHVSEMKRRLRGVAGKGSSQAKALRAPVTSIAKVEADRGRKNSRVKGSRAELDVARMFSEWCGEEVRRTPLSGGWSNARFGVTADLVCANPAWPFHCEVKHRERWCLDDLVTGRRSDGTESVVQWWLQCVRSCPTVPGFAGSKRFAKQPLLVFRRNRQPWLVMTLWGEEESRARFVVPDGLGKPWVVSVTTLEMFLIEEPVSKGLRAYKIP